MNQNAEGHKPLGVFVSVAYGQAMISRNTIKPIFTYLPSKNGPGG